jgi:hypothetical protein
MSLEVLTLALLVGAVSLLVLTDAWRVALPALVATSAVVAVLVGGATHPAIGVVQVVTGAFAVAVLAATLQVLGGTTGAFVQYAFGLPYRVATGLFALAVAYSLAVTYPVADTGPALNFALYWLAAVGMMTLVLARRVLAVSYAIFLLDEAASILLAVFSEGPGLARLLLAGFGQLAIAVAVAYLLYIEHAGEPVS